MFNFSDFGSIKTTLNWCNIIKFELKINLIHLFNVLSNLSKQNFYNRKYCVNFIRRIDFGQML